jgi:hypothetical protein
MGNWARTLIGLEKEMAGEKTNARHIKIPKIHALLSMIFPPLKTTGSTLSASFLHRVEFTPFPARAPLGGIG